MHALKWCHVLEFYNCDYTRPRRRISLPWFRSVVYARTTAIRDVYAVHISYLKWATWTGGWANDESEGMGGNGWVLKIFTLLKTTGVYRSVLYISISYNDYGNEKKNR